MSDITAKQTAMRDRQDTLHKRCTACQERKPYAAFAQNTKRDGTKTPRSICKACDSTKQAVYRARVKVEREAFQAEKAKLALERAQLPAGDSDSVRLDSGGDVSPQVNLTPPAAISCQSCGPDPRWVDAGCKVHGLGLVIDTREKATRSSLETANGLYGL